MTDSYAIEDVAFDRKQFQLKSRDNENVFEKKLAKYSTVNLSVVQHLCDSSVGINTTQLFRPLIDSNNIFAIAFLEFLVVRLRLAAKKLQVPSGNCLDL